MTTDAVDRSGDVISPDGVQYKLPIVLLFNHDHSKPIGSVTAVQKMGKGLMATAVLAAPGISPDADTCWGLIQAGVLKGLSIGFRPLDVDSLDTGIAYTGIECYELSVVAVPCNPQATIIAFDTEAKSVPGAAKAAKSGIPADAKVTHNFTRDLAARPRLTKSDLYRKYPEPK
jgi:HK97 family phage prohead protease